MADRTDDDESPVRTRRPRMAPSAQAAAILDGAERLFLEHGFAETSMDMLVAATGGSKRDVYVLFGDKRALFQKVVDNLSREGALALKVDETHETLEGALTSVARSFMRFLLSERALNLHRLMVADAARLGQTGRAFLLRGPRSAYHEVAICLRAFLGGQAISTDDAEVAARIFVDGFSADLQLRALLGDSPSPIEVDRRIDAAVRIFINGMYDQYGRPSQGARGGRLPRAR